MNRSSYVALVGLVLAGFASTGCSGSNYSEGVAAATSRIRVDSAQAAKTGKLNPYLPSPVGTSNFNIRIPKVYTKVERGSNDFDATVIGADPNYRGDVYYGEFQDATPTAVRHQFFLFADKLDGRIVGELDKLVTSIRKRVPLAGQDPTADKTWQRTEIPGINGGVIPCYTKTIQSKLLEFAMGPPDQDREFTTPQGADVGQLTLYAVEHGGQWILIGWACPKHYADFYGFDADVRNAISTLKFNDEPVAK